MSFVIVSLFVVACILGTMVFIRHMMRYSMVDDFDEYEDSVEVTTTVTTTNVHGFDVVGKLQRLRDGNQFYVNDPVDKDKVWLNSNDDYYEDGAGNIWELT